MTDLKTLIKAQERALALTPGIIAARRREDYEGAMLLQHSYMDYCQEIGLPYCQGTAMLTVAAMKIADIALAALAKERGLTPEQMSVSLSTNLAMAGLGD